MGAYIKRNSNVGCIFLSLEVTLYEAPFLCVSWIIDSTFHKLYYRYVTQVIMGVELRWAKL